MPTTQTYWCTNCRAYKQAWTNEPNRCWSCDNYTLFSANLPVRPASTILNADEVRRLVNEVNQGQIQGFSLESQGRNSNGDYICEVLECRNGIYSHSVIKRNG